MEHNHNTRWLVVLVLLGILIGTVGGGVMGGVVGLTIAQSRPAVALPVPNVQLTSAQAPVQPAVTNLSVNEDSAVIDTVKKTEPAVVTVVNTLQGGGQRSFGQGGATPSVAEGSGVVIDAQGHIVTNNHVVESASQLDVIYSDGTKATAKLVGGDPVSDIAILQVSGNVPAYVPLGDSSSLQLGESVIAIGSPLGSYRGSVTVGVVSGMNRSVAGTDQEGLIQTDAAINHGNSGGPLLNLAGQVIGINTLVVRDTTTGDQAEGLGFAIPSNVVATVAQQLMSQGKVSYPFIGITYGPITPQNAGEMNLPVQQGVIVSQVTSNSPAGAAGIQTGDIITALDGVKIDESHSLRSILFKYHPGDTITASVVRGGQTLSLKITLVARPAESNASTPG